MVKKQPTEKQLAARKKFGEAAKKRAEEAKKAKQMAQESPKPVEKKELPTDVQEPDKESMQRQIDELMADNALFKAALLQKSQVGGKQTPQVNQQGSLIGVFERYVLDPENYPSPIERLMAEPRLAPLAFEYNYHMDYKYTTRQYDTKQGINTIEPEFTITLWKNVLDPDTQDVVKRYRARRLILHEDPQAAMTIAHDNNILIDKEDERNFLNEMRYLRVRDWLFDIFYPKPAQATDRMREEVIGNQLVEVVTVNSETPVDLTGQMAKIQKKL